MTNLTQARVAIVGVAFVVVGIAISGVLRATPGAVRDHAMHFDARRGQAGFLLMTVEYREIGMGLTVVGIAMICLALVRSKLR